MGYGIAPSLPTPPGVNLKTSSPQISVLVNPAQLLKVGPRRKCRRKTAHGICCDWIWPVSDHTGHVQVSLIFLSYGVFSAERLVWMWVVLRQALRCKISLSVFNSGHWWLLGKPHWNINTSKNNHYPKPISLSLHIWQPQSFAFLHKYCSLFSGSLSHGNSATPLLHQPPSVRSSKTNRPPANWPACCSDIFIYHSLDKEYL